MAALLLNSLFFVFKISFLQISALTKTFSVVLPCAQHYSMLMTARRINAVILKHYRSNVDVDCM